MEDVNFPLMIKGGLENLTIQYPTIKDLTDYPVIEITSDLPWDPEQGGNEKAPRNIKKYTTDHDALDLEELQPCLGWKPTEVIKKTLEATTQYVKSSLRIPMRRHFKTRNRSCFVKRLRETF